MLATNGELPLLITLEHTEVNRALLVIMSVHQPITPRVQPSRMSVMATLRPLIGRRCADTAQPKGVHAMSPPSSSAVLGLQSTSSPAGKGQRARPATAAGTSKCHAALEGLSHGVGGGGGGGAPPLGGGRGAGRLPCGVPDDGGRLPGLLRGGGDAQLGAPGRRPLLRAGAGWLLQRQRLLPRRARLRRPVRPCSGPPDDGEVAHPHRRRPSAPEQRPGHRHLRHLGPQLAHHAALRQPGRQHRPRRPRYARRGWGLGRTLAAC